MKIPIYQVDAFTSEIFKGNPAAVCPLYEWLPDKIMQNIAMENNLSETAFFLEENNIYNIRWFTPKAELDLAGHPTLATAHVILKELKKNLEILNFKSYTGENLIISFKNNLYTMNFPARPPQKIENIELVNEALGKRPKELLAYRDLIAVFDDQDEISSMDPDLEKLKQLNYPSVVITAPGYKSDFVSRNFAPKLGIPEDPVTGSSHCELIPYWSKIFKKKEMIAYQISSRGGKIYCKYNNERVDIGGEAITFLKGEINLNL
jgi:PhzF family phenazine biosynthesis protein